MEDKEMSNIDFTQTTSLSAEGKDVKYLGINGSLAWSKVDGDANLSAYMSEQASRIYMAGSQDKVGSGQYICPNGQSYTYQYDNEYY